jgi:hypothetical protein
MATSSKMPVVAIAMAVWVLSAAAFAALSLRYFNDRSQSPVTPGAAIGLQQVAAQLERWALPVGLLTREWNGFPGHCVPLEPPSNEAAIALDHDEMAQRVIDWLRSDARRRLQLSFDAFVDDGGESSWNSLRISLVSYEAGLAFAIGELRGFDPLTPPQALKRARADWLKPLRSGVEPPRTETEINALRAIVERSEAMAEDLHKANRRLAAYHKLSCPIAS